MAIYLGNLSAEQMAHRLGMKLSPEELEKLEAMREQTCDKIEGRPVWHCYDIPFVIACGTYDACVAVRDILQPHVAEMRGSVEIALTQPEIEQYGNVPCK